jgi:dethiobiotin synthetase
MRPSLFVTGTDTDCGKTHVSLALIDALSQRGFRVAGFKPVAAGAQLSDGEWHNDDALALRDASNIGLTYPEVNPFCFPRPVSPHIEAQATHTRISRHIIAARLHRLELRADRVVVEGAGGWHVPLGPDLDIARLACYLELPVVLVVGLRLGCLNHALLSVEAIRASGATLLGWIGSQVDPAMMCLQENLDTLVERLDAPCFGVLPHPASTRQAFNLPTLDLDALLASWAITGS